MHYFLDIADNRGVDHIENQIYYQHKFTGIPLSINNGWYLFTWFDVYKFNDELIIAHIIDGNMAEFVRMK